MSLTNAKQGADDGRDLKYQKYQPYLKICEYCRRNVHVKSTDRGCRPVHKVHWFVQITKPRGRILN